LHTIIELRLRSAGLKVLSEDEDARDPENNPKVELDVTILATGPEGGLRDGYTFFTSLVVREYRVSPRNSALVPMHLWQQGRLNLSGPARAGSEIERVVNELLDNMLNEWLKANPKRQ